MTVLGLTLAVFLSQLPAIQAQQPALRGRVEGVVLRAGSNEPVVGARVTLSRPSELSSNTSSSTTGPGNSINLFQVPAVPASVGNAPPPPSVIPPMPFAPVLTDNAGKFAFTEVEAGTFRLLVQLDGYVRQEYGQRTFQTQGTPLTLRAGEVLKDLTLRLTPAGNLGGRIMNNLGKPAASVPLRLMKVTYNQAGQRTLQNVGSSGTNDRGEYRFFWITPGRYYLAGGTPQGTPANAAQNESGDNYTFTYFPGVQDISRASVVEILPGGELVADFIVPKQELYTIRGRIVDPSAAVPPPSASIALAHMQLTGSNSMFSRNPFYDSATGAFELRDVLPGPYVVYANTLGGSARAPVEVVNANIEGVVLTVNAGITIAGRASVENGRMPTTGLRLQMRPMVGGSPTLIGNFPSTPGGLGPDGTFVINNVLPGQYRIVPQLPNGYYVKQMRFDRTDALSQPVEAVQRGQDAPTLDVVLSTNVSEIEGTINDARLQVAAGATVALVPDTDRDRIELYKTATSDQAGRFTLRSIAPGDYKLFAWQDLEPFGYFDPDLLRKSEMSGKAVRVNESSKLSVNAQVIPAN
jgi:hypothetical protein